MYFRYLTNVSYLSVGENDLTQLPDEIGIKLTMQYKISPSSVQVAFNNKYEICLVSEAICVPSSGWGISSNHKSESFLRVLVPVNLIVFLVSDLN